MNKQTEYYTPWQAARLIIAFLALIFFLAWLVSCTKHAPQPYKGWIGTDSSYVAPDHAPAGYPKH